MMAVCFCVLISHSAGLAETASIYLALHGKEVLTAFVYEDVGAIFLDLKSRLQAIF